MRRAFALALLVACTEKPNQPPPDLANPKIYADTTIGLQYPGNWTVEKTEKKIGDSTVTTLNVAPDQGFGTIYVAKPKAEVDLERFRAMVRKRIDDVVKAATANGAKVGATKEQRDKVKRTI